MKIAVSGKGGVGKTTLAGALARLYASAGRTVLAVDADPDCNLASAVGLPPEQAELIKPLADEADLIEARTGARPGSSGGIFALNPKVDDLADRYGVIHAGVRLLVMGKAKGAGSGCYCPENSLIRRLLAHLVVRADEVVILDMEAGIEHLTRGTGRHVDAFLVVVEPGQRSLQTARQVLELAHGLGIQKVWLVGNKVRSAEDERFITDGLPQIPLLGFIPYAADVVAADLAGSSPFDTAPALMKAVRQIKGKLDERF
ncbi:MAG TPA: carbon monoxide dehydrogenase accessory protein CooC, partial [Geobacterales bacterium]|nr:carbon monoxide dehydrogenase accessory protein CooC [Geobacterales bacterium]